MKLAIAYNWDLNLLRRLSELDVSEVFASLNKSVLGSGRSKRGINKIDFSEIAKHVKEAHSYGIKFNYLVNSTFLPNVSNKKIKEYLSNLKSQEIDIITIAHPRIISIANELKIDVNISTNAHINKINQIETFPFSTTKRVTLDTNLNRELTALKKFSTKTNKELEILVNQGCLYKCSQRDEHNNIISKLSQNKTSENKEYFEAEKKLVERCHKARCSKSYKLIESPWIRPEDIEKIEKFLGKEIIFKIAGRELGSDWIYHSAKAYSEKKYNGNLFDIVYIYGGDLLENKKSFYLDNPKIPSNFINVLIKKDGNGKLNYLKEVANSTVRIEEGN